jgi:3D (Asp-Asp-Asp) domain-containing protein
MKKIAVLIGVTLFFGLLGHQVIEAKKKEVFVLSRQIISPQVLTKIDVRKKKLKNGILIVMKSKDEKRIQVLKAFIQRCLKQAEALTDDSNYHYELLYRKGVTCTVTEVKNGFQLQMVSDDPELVKIVKKVYIPTQKRQLDVTSDIEGREGVTDDEIQ